MGGKIKIFYIFLFLLIPIKNFSQSKIIGFVKDSTNQTGILANVILKNSVDNSIVTFTSTNNDGSYLLEIENIGEFILSFSDISVLKFNRALYLEKVAFSPPTIPS